MRTLDEYRKHKPVASVAPSRAADPARLQGMVQESVRIEALTADENWDYFLRYLEFAIKSAERLRDQEMERLRSPELVNDDAVRLCRAKVAHLDTRIAVLKEVLMVPKTLKERGAAARAQLEDLAQGA